MPPNESKPTPKIAATAAAAPKLTSTTGTAAAPKASRSSSASPCLFSMRGGELTDGVAGDVGKAAALLTGVPRNVTLTPFAGAFHPTTKASEAPRELVR
ncbi:unnamed protein product [Miscanthus lutarioriparius]|uniref:Uncharacterized protein n=1 Tax=Miscanthus lutarioriparius TaxID=422564 RepID=A0A811MUH3_9POAL|nr:unnamed protein product [Miscanthus lutarioriparius]